MKKYGGRRGIDPLMEFLDNGETCNTASVVTGIFPLSCKHIYPTNIHKNFESYSFLLQVWKTAVAFETSRVYIVVYVL
jgi:hypothetical protein